MRKLVQERRNIYIFTFSMHTREILEVSTMKMVINRKKSCAYFVFLKTDKKIKNSNHSLGFRFQVFNSFF